MFRNPDSRGVFLHVIIIPVAGLPPFDFLDCLPLLVEVNRLTDGIQTWLFHSFPPTNNETASQGEKEKYFPSRDQSGCFSEAENCQARACSSLTASSSIRWPSSSCFPSNSPSETFPASSRSSFGISLSFFFFFSPLHFLQRFGNTRLLLTIPASHHSF